MSGEIIAANFEIPTKQTNTLQTQNVEFLGALSKLQKATVRFVMASFRLSVCLSVRPHGTTRLPVDVF